VTAASDDGGLGRAAVQAADLLVDSLEALEVLVLLARDPSVAWTTDQIASHLRIPLRSASREVARLTAAGILTQLNGEATSYHLGPADQARATAAACLVEAYGTRRIELINHVASRALKRVQAIADAFRVKKEPGDA
jgi:hypothetical protein